MGNSIYLGGGIKSAFCGGNVKEIWQGSNKVFGGGGSDKLIIDGYEYQTKLMADGRLWCVENIKAVFDSGCRYENEAYRNTYGVLYTYDKACEIANSIKGWHLPTKAEFETLRDCYGGQYSASPNMKSTWGWSSGNGNNSSGWNGVPTGKYSSATGNLENKGYEAFYWCITKEGQYPYYFDLYFNNNWAQVKKLSNASWSVYLHSIRLVKDI